MIISYLLLNLEIIFKLFIFHGLIKELFLQDLILVFKLSVLLFKRIKLREMSMWAECSCTCYSNLAYLILDLHGFEMDIIKDTIDCIHCFC